MRITQTSENDDDHVAGDCEPGQQARLALLQLCSAVVICTNLCCHEERERSVLVFIMLSAIQPGESQETVA